MKRQTEHNSRGVPEEKKMRIGAFSEALGMNASQVRYYEKLELIESTHDQSSGYRYYEPKDSFDLINMKTLRSFGLSLKDAQQILSGDGDGDQIWRRHIEELDRQIRQLEAARDAGLYYMRSSAEDAQPCVEYRDAIFFLQHGRWNAIEADEQYGKVVKKWIPHMPEAGYWGIFDAQRFRGGHCDELLSGFSIFEKCVIREHVPVPEGAVRVPEGRYLKWFYDGEFDDYWKEEKLEEAYTWAEKHGYTLSGTGVWHFLRNRKQEGRNLVRYVLYFPVHPA